MLLLQRRLKNREATTRRLLASSNSLIAIKSPCVTKDNLNVECVYSSISQRLEHQTNYLHFPLPMCFGPTVRVC